MLDGLDAKGGGNVGLASSRAANEHHVLRAVHELATMQGPDGGFIDLAGGEVKTRKILVGWCEVDQKTIRGTVFSPNADFM